MQGRRNMLNMDYFFKAYDFVQKINEIPFLSSLRNRFLLCITALIFLILGFIFPEIKIPDMNIFTTIGILGLIIFALSTVMAIFGEHKISELTGNWRAVRGNGFILAPENFFEVRNVCVNASILTEDNDKTINVNASATWDIYQGNIFIRTIPMKFEERDVKIQRFDFNAWRYVSPNSENKITLSLKSASVAEVLEEGRLTFNNVILPYKVNYSLCKQQ